MGRYLVHFCTNVPPILFSELLFFNMRRSSVVLSGICLPSHMGEIACFNYCKHSQFFREIPINDFSQESRNYASHTIRELLSVYP